MDQLRSLQSRLLTLQLSMHGAGLGTKALGWHDRERTTLRGLPPPTYPPVSLHLRNPRTDRQREPATVLGAALAASSAPEGTAVQVRNMVTYTTVYLDIGGGGATNDSLSHVISAGAPVALQKTLQLGREQNGSGALRALFLKCEFHLVLDPAY